MGVLGNVGGLLQVMTILICYFIDPISEHTYNLKAISSFYLIKCNKYKQIFGQQEMNKIISL